MRLVFAGTPDAAVPSLRALAATSHEIAAVITRVDAPVGRRRTLTPSPVADTAAELGLSTIKAGRLDDAVTDEIAALRPDLGVVVAYGGLVRPRLLAVPRLGWINLHFSLLPRWRGAAPVQWSIIEGDTTTGASVFQLVEELDAGDVLEESAYEIPETATAGDVLATLAESGAELLAHTVDRLAEGAVTPRAQTGTPTYARKLSAEDGRVDWTQDAARVSARIRGASPEPGAWTTVDGDRLKLLDARHVDADIEAGLVEIRERTVLVGAATGAVALDRVQPSGKRPMAALDWWRGLRRDDVRLGS